MRHSKYHTLLPAPQTQSDSSPSTSITTPEVLPARKRVGTRSACESCRVKKTRCDGARPKCSNCIRRSITPCVYIEKRGTEDKALLELIDLFKSLPAEQASELLTIFKREQLPSEAIQIFKNEHRDGEWLPDGLPDGLLDGTPDGLPEGLREEAAAADRMNEEFEANREPTESLETELTSVCPNLYPALPHIAAADIVKSNLLRPLGNQVPESDDANLIETTQTRAAGVDHTWLPHADSDSSVRQSRFPIAPSGHVEYCDERLRGINVTFWTNIDVSGDFVARVISLYVKTDHPLLGLFSPSLLVTDMVSERNRFCSHFLFHALMYLGCQMYSAFEKDVAGFADQFSTRAEEIWKAEKGRDSYVTMAGAVLLSLSLMGQGRDHTVTYYAIQATRMGERLGLLGSNAVGFLGTMTEEDKIASCYAAWGTFNWNMVIAIFYRQPGLHNPASSPVLPIPGVQGPHRQETSDDVLLGTSFPEVCRFWKIIHEARWLFYAEDSPPENFKTVLVEYRFRQLIAWADRIPLVVTRREGCAHHTVVFQYDLSLIFSLRSAVLLLLYTYVHGKLIFVFSIWIHAAILDLFRHFIGKPDNQRPRLETFVAPDNFPDVVFNASVAQLKRLVVEFRTNYASSMYSFLWHTGLIYLANAMVQDTDDPEWRVYFLLCIYSYESLRRPYRISQVIVQGLLTMTLRHGNISGIDAKEIMRVLKDRDPEPLKEALHEVLRAPFMGDLHMALTDPERASIESLAGEFDHLALFDEWLQQDKMID
ncbi:hypothetical protein F4778DRAFT_775620 [Xylariomycetidae sp. FL2044]|nr:hypothetical protein F4778DRAFT_775620 [Xylariomycetidae sp. FL2044]